MQFRTELAPDALPFRIGLNTRIVSIGSCFAEVMGQRLAELKRPVVVNPFGTVFNPISIGRQVRLALLQQPPDERLYVQRDGVWLHHHFHSCCWAPTRPQLQEKLLGLLEQTADALQQADVLLLTFGTAMVYEHLETSQIVANCHKMPMHQFRKFLHPLPDLEQDAYTWLELLKQQNPNVQVLLTVSPVRHTRDTLPLNSVSKATLRLLAHTLSQNPDTGYFPAFELVTDDLRDYRFYEADLVHPNHQAHTYVFEKLAAVAFDAELKTFAADWQSIRQGLAHRPLHDGQSAAHRHFLQQLLQKIEGWQDRIDVSAELATVRSRLGLE